MVTHVSSFLWKRFFGIAAKLMELPTMAMEEPVFPDTLQVSSLEMV